MWAQVSFTSADALRKMKTNPICLKSNPFFTCLIRHLISLEPWSVSLQSVGRWNLPKSRCGDGTQRLAKNWNRDRNPKKMPFPSCQISDNSTKNLNTSSPLKQMFSQQHKHILEMNNDLFFLHHWSYRWQTDPWQTNRESEERFSVPVHSRSIV